MGALVKDDDTSSMDAIARLYRGVRENLDTNHVLKTFEKAVRSAVRDKVKGLEGRAVQLRVHLQRLLQAGTARLELFAPLCEAFVRHLQGDHSHCPTAVTCGPGGLHDGCHFHCYEACKCLGRCGVQQACPRRRSHRSRRSRTAAGSSCRSPRRPCTATRLADARNAMLASNLQAAKAAGVPLTAAVDHTYSHRRGAHQSTAVMLDAKTGRFLEVEHALLPRALDLEKANKENSDPRRSYHVADPKALEGNAVANGVAVGALVKDDDSSSMDAIARLHRDVRENLDTNHVLMTFEKAVHDDSSSMKAIYPTLLFPLPAVLQSTPSFSGGLSEQLTLTLCFGVIDGILIKSGGRQIVGDTLFRSCAT